MRTSRFVAALCCFILLSSVAFAAAPKGHLIIIGGGGNTDKIRRSIVDLSGGTQAKILVITTAGSNPAEDGKSFVETLLRLGAGEAFRIAPTRDQCNDPEYVRKVTDRVSGVYFTGGSQSRITDTIRGSLLHKRLMEIYENGGLISGSSAGAAMMSKKMITGRRVDGNDDGFKDIAADMVDIAEGLGFIDGVIIDQHFLKRSRENRLFSAAFENPECVCIGIDEATAILVSKGRDVEVMGKSSVMVIEPDAKSVKVDDKKHFGGKAKVRLLFEGDKFKLKR